MAFTDPNQGTRWEASPHEQGSIEWHNDRLGMVTASRFKEIMTNGRGKDTMGQTAYSYMYDLVAELLTGQAQDKIDNRAIQWGHDNEPQARAMYSLLRDCRVYQVGFLKSLVFPGVGGSPDGLLDPPEEDPEVGPGGVEIKCPMSSRIHLGYLEFGGVPKDYQWQVQGLMWVTGRKWWDFVSFDPRMPSDLQLFVHRELADLDKHDELERRYSRFKEQMDIKFDAIQSGRRPKVSSGGRS